MESPLLTLNERSLYDRIGPQALEALVQHFYARVAADPVIAPLFPEDLTETAQRQYAFLSGLTGGPPLYHERYGHPRLRARHLPFALGKPQVQAWLRCMQAALNATPEIGPTEARELYALLSRIAPQMVSTPPETFPVTYTEPHDSEP
ncbi:globin [Deinococcus lacus]|uniref:Globin n=1 Tax=Deinococcus lacus TaxID=392561 RepID=A0ABW1Y9T3_9DEIO